MLRKFLGLILLVISVWLLLLATGWSLPYKIILNLLVWLRTNALFSAVLAFLGLFIGLYLLREGFFKPPIIQLTKINNGEVRISQAVVEQIAARSIAGLSGLKSIKIKVKQEPEGLIIKCYCRPDHSFDLKSDSSQIQKNISQDIEKITGIKVKEVRVVLRVDLWKK
ncbi:MAG: alkaline shock response membrane anchor protein AmaP [Peptococcaceae bacterium]|nr:alkaline shock response membrane anchor protein AmaP [Peptococcaceae bacterium]